MKIAYIAAGAGGMYCGTCLHDNTLAAALQRRGHDVALVPTYTPIRTDEPGVSIDRVFFGAVNVYLQQKITAFRSLPLFDRLLDRPGLLRQAAKLGGSTDPTSLGALTLSVLKGEDGFQARELAKLVDWLRDDFRPEIVHLTNSMFAGFARTLKRELGVPVLCSLQGEDLFLDQLREPWKERVFAVLRERARDVDAFLVNSRWYGDTMAACLDVEPERMRVIPLGVSLDGYEKDSAPGVSGDPGDYRPLTIGYLARICPEKGLHVLVEAFRLLTASEPGPVRLAVAGWLGERDRSYFKDIQERIAGWGLSGFVEHAGELDRDGKLRFLHGLDILSVPTTYKEPKGLFVLEALASGVPVVEPRHGSFPEMIEATGGGVLVEPGSAEALAEGLRSLLRDPEKRRALGRQGREAVHAEFDDETMANRTLAVYRDAMG